jgi:hypothetical protein
MAGHMVVVTAEKETNEKRQITVCQHKDGGSWKSENRAKCEAMARQERQKHTMFMQSSNEYEKG